MRVLHCIPNMLSGGAQQQLTYLASEQVRVGHDVHVAFLHEGPKSARLDATGASVERLTARGNNDPFLFGKIRALIGRLRPDIVQTWLLQMDVLGGAAASWTRVPWVLSERGSAEAHRAGPKNTLRAWIGRRADAVVSNSREGDRYWASHAGSRPLRRVVRNGIPLEAIRTTLPMSSERAGLRENERMILYVGRLSPEKNLENLIPALGSAASVNSAVAFLCGDGTHEAEARALVARLQLADHVRIIGYVDDVWSWMKRADVFVSVSHHEGHPNTVLEAAACGVPLVLSEIPQHREILDGPAALFVDRFDQQAVADAIGLCFRDPAAARARAEQARCAVEPLSISEMARQYEDVYRDVLARRGRSVS